VDREVVDGLEEAAVIPALGAPPRAAGTEHLQHNSPILIRHSRQHGGSPLIQPAMNHQCAGLGAHFTSANRNPSTGPSGATLTVVSLSAIAGVLAVVCFGEGSHLPLSRGRAPRRGVGVPVLGGPEGDQAATADNLMTGSSLKVASDSRLM
jgi:hypothetical protein